jgi:hypothetical protein
MKHTFQDTCTIFKKCAGEMHGIPFLDNFYIEFVNSFQTEAQSPSCTTLPFDGFCSISGSFFFQFFTIFPLFRISIFFRLSITEETQLAKMLI